MLQRAEKIIQKQNLRYIIQSFSSDLGIDGFVV
jgi:hypothetical protein